MHSPVFQLRPVCHPLVKWLIVPGLQHSDAVSRIYFHKYLNYEKIVLRNCTVITITVHIYFTVGVQNTLLHRRQDEVPDGHIICLGCPFVLPSIYLSVHPLTKRMF